MDFKRTDLAVEAKEIWSESPENQTKLSGVEAFDKKIGDVNVTVVKILDEKGAAALCKPVGNYITLEVDTFLHRDKNAFEKTAMAIGSELSSLLRLTPDDGVLVVGLGNEDVTPDAIGPWTADGTMVTRHLKAAYPDDFALFRSVSVIKPGVLGTTGIESADLIQSAVKRVKPRCVIAVDALTSRSMDRICRTVQISDTGISPGSGVGSARTRLDRESMGIPVIAVGVPTVVDAGTLSLDIAEKAGFSVSDPDVFRKSAGDMIVTPKDIDARAADMAKLLSYGINLALHPGITVSDIEMFVS